MTNPEQIEDTKFGSQLQWAWRAVLAIWVSAIFAYVLKFHSWPISDSPAEWGQFGDYIGGFVNPVIGLATVILVVLSINIQRKELQATKIELKATGEATNRMAFEQSLFSWLSNYSRLLEGVQHEGMASGRGALRAFHASYFAQDKSWLAWKRKFPGEYAVAGGVSADQTLANVLAKPGDPGYHAALEGLYRESRQGFLTLLDSHGSELVPFLNTLSSLIEWVDQSDLTDQQRWTYATVVRSQLSWLEKSFLFYFSLDQRRGPLAALINKYALLDDLQNVDAFHLLMALRLTRKPPLDRAGGNVSQEWKIRREAFDSAAAQLKMLSEPDLRHSSATQSQT